MSSKLTTGDAFPDLTLTLITGEQVTIPERLQAPGYQVVLFFRGKFWPYCLRQLGGFSDQYQELQNLNASVIAASTDTLENSAEIAADKPFRLSHGVTREQAQTLGSWWEDRRGLIQPSDFILNHQGDVLSATYSSASVGRLEAVDAVRFIQFQEKLRLAES